ncbi:MAG: bacteriohemerythrin [Desulfuromonadaceae bacterium]|nr:bacteriohemerythrin [Desulfuromonadaceae bacterium]MDD5104723.1 bacteriohemerythrin [Desulfuromonadaceae bacterium]
MSLVEWDEGFDLGISEFDEHHRHLLLLVNMTYDGFTHGASHDEIGAVLNELARYTEYHFTAEEHWMEMIQYPRLAEHKEEHRLFSQRVENFHNEFLDGNAALPLNVLQFLTSWLIDHILKSDTAYGNFAKTLPTGDSV